MASFTTVGDSLELFVQAAGEDVSVAISGTYAMDIRLQMEMGSKGSGAWRDVGPLFKWTTADATVAAVYTTQGVNTNLRLFVVVDTSGTATVTLTDGDKTLATQVDDFGTVLSTQTQARKLFATAVRFNGNTPVNLTAATLTLTADAHAFRTVTANKADGWTVTLPAATGTGHEYTVFVGTTITSVGGVIKVVSAADSFGGGVSISTDIAGVTMLAAATSDTLTMNGSTTGGLVGSYVKITDVASGKFMVEGFLASSGVETTPWSAAV